MKKTILLTALIGASLVSWGQTKKDTAKYEKFVKVPISDYQQLVGLADAYKGAVKYNPLISDKDSRAFEANLEKYLFDLPKRVKLDSVKVK